LSNITRVRAVGLPTRPRGDSRSAPSSRSYGTVAAAFRPPVIRRLYKPVRLTILREAITTALETP